MGKFDKNDARLDLLIKKYLSMVEGYVIMSSEGCVSDVDLLRGVSLS